LLSWQSIAAVGAAVGLPPHPQVHLLPAPDALDSEETADFHLLSLESLVRMKLMSFRDKDRTHLRDMLEVGLVDAAWCPRLPPELAARLQELVDHPEG
jgi:hypothetical protein